MQPKKRQRGATEEHVGKARQRSFAHIHLSQSVRAIVNILG